MSENAYSEVRSMWEHHTARVDSVNQKSILRAINENGAKLGHAIIDSVRTA
jgi:hypothetical protein